MTARFTEEELIRAIETSYYDDISALCTGIPGSFCRKEPDMIIYFTGLPIPLFNGILGPRFSSRGLSKRAESAMSYFKSKRVPMRWVLGPSSAPSGLEGFLLEKGMISEPTIPGMAIDLKVVENEPLPSGLEIQPVEDMKSLINLIDILAEAFEFPEQTRRGWGDIIKELWRESNFSWFLGILNGVPVATSLLVLHQEVACIYMVATLKEARGKGIGSAITREPLLLAKDAGYDVAVLEASELGLPVYERLGFRRVCEFRILTWKP